MSEGMSYKEIGEGHNAYNALRAKKKEAAKKMPAKSKWQERREMDLKRKGK